MIRLIAGLLVLFTLMIEPASAQSTEDIINALVPSKGPATHSRTRGLQIGTQERGVTIEGEDSDKPPSIDLQIPFDYNSDKLTPDGITILRRLGEALKDPRLAKDQFKIAGHTDAKGTIEYNQKLSERRAAAVRDYLIFQYDVEASRIQAVGFGERQLADPAHPEDAINRRVQVINVGAGSASAADQ